MLPWKRTASVSYTHLDVYKRQGIYAAVLHALGNMDKDLTLIAKDDEMGRQMQDLKLMTRKRASRRNH